MAPPRVAAAMPVRMPSIGRDRTWSSPAFTPTLPTHAPAPGGTTAADGPGAPMARAAHDGHQSGWDGSDGTAGSGDPQRAHAGGSTGVTSGRLRLPAWREGLQTLFGR